jgi:hypothetical protein
VKGPSVTAFDQSKNKESGVRRQELGVRFQVSGKKIENSVASSQDSNPTLFKSPIRNPKLGTRPKGGSPQDKSEIPKWFPLSLHR